MVSQQQQKVSDFSLWIAEAQAADLEARSWTVAGADPLGRGGFRHGVGFI